MTPYNSIPRFLLPIPGRHVRRAATGLLAAAVMLAAITPASPPAHAGQVQTLPPEPTLMPGDPGVPDLYGFDATGPGGSYEFTNPYVPPLSTSRDHRVGVVRKSVSGGNLRFHLLVPEKYRNAAQTLLDEEGPDLLSPADGEELPLSHFFHQDDPENEETGTRALEHVAICDRSTDANPSACTGDPTRDCYTLVVVAGTSTVDMAGLPAIRLFSREVEVKVSNPKTGTANLDAVTPLGTAPAMGPLLTGAPAAGNFEGIHDFQTPIIAGDDNRLILVRFGFPSRFAWTDNGGNPIEGNYDPVYAYNGTHAECDINGWDENFKPLAFAPDDTTPTVDGQTVNTKYGFARHPFRSPSNQPIDTFTDPLSVPPGGVWNIQGRYLWMDHDADNVFFGSLVRTLMDHSDECRDPEPGQAPVCLHTYDFSCVPGTLCRDDCSAPEAPAGCVEVDDEVSENTPTQQGWMMMGLWTRGKMVLLDSTVNHADFGLRGSVEHQRLVDLYDGPPVRVGAVNDAGAIGDIPYGWIDTTVQFGSTEHFFNAVPEMRPKTPRDVVWQISAIMQSDEIAFDDYITPHTLIFSPMNALKEMTSNGAYYDGVGTQMRLQNAATSDFWEIPAYGEVVAPDATKGRIEHVALGGIKARGFYLYPETRIDYDIPSVGQPSMGGREWLLSLFLDRKIDPASTTRRLVTFPSGASISLTEVAGADHVQWCGSAPGSCVSTALPKGNPADRWTHLAFVLEQTATPTSDRARIFQDGFLFADVARPAGLEIAPGRPGGSSRSRGFSPVLQTVRKDSSSPAGSMRQSRPLLPSGVNRYADR